MFRSNREQSGLVLTTGSRNSVPEESDLTLLGMVSYAAPIAGTYVFYIPMWGIVPGVYTKYFGLSLTAIGSIMVFARLLDAATDLTVGHLSDRRRALGGSRVPWVVIGGVGVIAACHFLFAPHRAPSIASFALLSSLFFVAFAVGEIPHLSWGSELTLDYHRRAQVYGARYIASRVGLTAFYALPLLLGSATDTAFTPQILRTASYIGSVIIVAGVLLAAFCAPAGIVIKASRSDKPGHFMKSIVESKPLLLYLMAAACTTLCYGMWYGLFFIYLDGFLAKGREAASMLVVATVASTLSTPLWLLLIRRTNKATAWAVGLALFIVQSLIMAFLRPQSPWVLVLLPVLLANLCFVSNDVAAMSVMGDIIDYGKWKFRRDEGATYFAIVNLVGKVGLGLGGGMALGIAGFSGFHGSDTIHSTPALWGLKFAFIWLPACLASACLLLVLRTPITRDRHRIIQRRLESLRMRGRGGPYQLTARAPYYAIG
jgi:glycoside/pentoside/hexuronide:cation symporter, GPH family